MPKKSKKFILNVVPLTKIPLTNIQSFSYLSETKLPSGTLVSIPLFHRKLEGIVLESRSDFERLGNIELKKIEKVLKEDFLDQKQIGLAQFISNYYISPLGVVMKNFVPKRAKTRGSKYKVESTKKNILASKKIKLTGEQKEAVKSISNIKYKMPRAKYLLFGPAASGKTEVYIHSILEFKKQNKDFQFLILVPEKTLTPQAMERYGAYFKSKEIVLLSSNLSGGQYYSGWKKIKSGETKIIIGTRMAVFAPFKKLGLIIIDEEQDMSYKQWDMNPRYDARTCAEKLAEIHKCPLVRGSATPSVESYWRATNKDLQLLKLSELKLEKGNFLKAKGSLPSAILVDMKKERWANLLDGRRGNYSCLSKKLQTEIAYALKYHQQIILLINRQGMSAFSVCVACKTVFKCPNCERALVYGREGFYKCAHCGHKSEIIPKCVHCGGIIFRNVGLGTQKVEKEVASLFPSARIIVADAASSREKDFHNKIYSAYSQGEADILVGTQMISKGWDLPRVSLVGIIDTDNMLSYPDFSNQEKAFQIISQVSGRINRPDAKFGGTVVIQTFQPENPLIKSAAERNYGTFYAREIEERKLLNLPPLGRMIRLIFQDYSPKKIEKEMARVYEILNKIPKIKATQPHSPLLLKIRGRFRSQIVIKIRREKIPKKLEKILEKIPSGWIIDVDPISII